MSFEDSVFIIVAIAIMVISAPVLMVFINVSNDVVQDSTNAPEGFKAESTRLQQGFPQLFQTWFLFFLGLSWIITLILAFRVDTNPAWFAVGIVFMFATIIVGLYTANIWSDSLLPSMVEAEEFRIITFIMSNFGKIAASMVFSVGLALYAKRQLF